MDFISCRSKEDAAPPATGTWTPHHDMECRRLMRIARATGVLDRLYWETVNDFDPWN